MESSDKPSRYGNASEGKKGIASWKCPLALTCNIPITVRVIPTALPERC